MGLGQDAKIALPQPKLPLGRSSCCCTAWAAARHRFTSCVSPTSSAGLDTGSSALTTGAAAVTTPAGSSQDVAAALRLVHSTWPSQEVILVGFSLSGNIVLNLAGQGGASHHPYLRRIMAICPPIDLEECSQALSSIKNRHIDRYYTGILMKTAMEKNRLFPELPSLDFPKNMNLRRFDEFYTAPRAGFKDRAAYYRQCSSLYSLSTIKIPTTILAAADDPIIPASVFDRISPPPCVTVRLESSGGHMGFMGAKRTRFGDYRWLDEAVIQWIAQEQSSAQSQWRGHG